jgi:hypothetical protein
MIILKTQLFSTPQALAKFVNANKINKEDIVEIVYAEAASINHSFVIFFYADSEVEEVSKDFWS